MISQRGAAHVVQATAVQQKVFTCSTGDVLSGAAINGRVVDLETLPGGRRFRVANPYINVYSTVGSTGADKKTTLAIKLQHGDSSGGGDMADYSTGQQPADAAFNTTGDSTTMQNWSTGTQFYSHAGSYEISAAKRYLRAVGTWTRGGSSTSTAAGSVDYAFLNMGIAFQEADRDPSAYSTSTSTSTST